MHTMMLQLVLSTVVALDNWLPEVDAGEFEDSESQHRIVWLQALPPAAERHINSR